MAAEQNRSRARRCLALAVLALGSIGCRQVFGLDDPLLVMSDGSIGDSSTIDARRCFGAGAYQVCASTLPAGPIVTNEGGSIDTATSPLCQSGTTWVSPQQPDACFIVGTSITITGSISVTGARPLVLLATSSITVSGKLDVASHRIAMTTGPGSPARSCLAGSAPANNSNGGGGGAGGSFMTLAGSGGPGNNDTTGNGIAAPIDASRPSLLRAGCPGQTGGTGSGLGGLRGEGGGAVYLVAAEQITLEAGASINASGAAASTALRRAGGGGGGSGGMIVLHAATFAGSGSLMANGGGGSSGGADAGGGGSNPGSEPTTPLVVAAGGSGTAPAGNGGDGFANATGATAGALGGSAAGGGGGGGGAGYIQANQAITGATTSPAPTIIP